MVVAEGRSHKIFFAQVHEPLLLWKFHAVSAQVGFILLDETRAEKVQIART